VAGRGPGLRTARAGSLPDPCPPVTVDLVLCVPARRRLSEMGKGRVCTFGGICEPYALAPLPTSGNCPCGRMRRFFMPADLYDENSGPDRYRPSLGPAYGAVARPWAVQIRVKPQDHCHHRTLRFGHRRRMTRRKPMAPPRHAWGIEWMRWLPCLQWDGPLRQGVTLVRGRLLFPATGGRHYGHRLGWYPRHCCRSASKIDLPQRRVPHPWHPSAGMDLFIPFQEGQVVGRRERGERARPG
jgi:hypothetical protein